MGGESQRIFLIGLDGATWDLIRPWASEGRLPAFRRLVKEGASGILKSTVPPLSPAAWTSIFTGLKPTKHSIWSFFKREKGSYYRRPISSRDINGRPLWQTLSENGITSVFINVPFFYPPSEFNGIITTGLGTPSKDSDFAYPHAVKGEILRLFPDYDVDFNEDKILMSADKSFIVNEIFKITDAHIRVFKHLYEREKKSARVFGAVLRSLDVIQHFFWEKWEVILRFYRQADELLDWCINKKEEEDVLIVCSDHGFRRVDKKVYVNKWLKVGGYLKEGYPRGKLRAKLLPSAESMHKLLIHLGFRNVIWKIKHSKHLGTLVRVFPSQKLSGFEGVRWKETQACFSQASFGIVQINLQGREPEGVVSKNEYEHVREKIIKELSELRDPKTGDVVLEFAKKGEDVYGPSGCCPDIIAYPRVGYVLLGASNKSDQIFEEETERHGDHALDGIICIHGGTRSKGALEDAHVWDIAPTILHILKVTRTNDVNGKVMKEIRVKRPQRGPMGPTRTNIREQVVT